MLIDRPSVREGSRIVNAVVASGISDPVTADAGELFYRTDLGQLRTYGTSGWQEVTVGAGGGTISAHIADLSVHLTSDQNVFLDAINLPTITGADVNSIPTLTSTVSGLSSSLGTHVADTALHLSPAQDALLDGLSPTLTATELNYVDGVTSPIQTQLNTTASGLSTHVSDGALHLTTDEDIFLDALDFIGETAATKANSVNGLTAHLTSTALHLSANQDLFLDALNLPTLQASEVNQLVGVTAPVQGQIDAKLNKAGDTMSGNLVMAGNRITGLPAAPSDPSDAVSQAYVDALNAGLSWKTAVLVATTGPITLSGSQTIDDVAITTSNVRVLVKNQAAAATNGIYLSNSSGAWSRAPDADTAQELDACAVFVQQGTLYADTAWVQTGTVTNVGTDPLAFSQFAAAGGAVAGNGIAITGSNISVRAGNGLTFGAPLPTDLTLSVTSAFTLGASLDLANVGTPGTYGSSSAVPSITVDSKGRVSGAVDAITITSASTPSTVVSRDGSGNFSAGIITASLTGNASTASTLQSARTIALSGGATGTATSFNGSANITIPVTALDATTLTGTIAAARLSGTYAINISGTAPSLSVGGATDANVDRGVVFSVFTNTTGSVNFPTATGLTLEARRASGSGSDAGTMQFYADAGAVDTLYWRKVTGYSAGDVWGAWRTVLHDGNFNTYAPTLTGGGASGTWGISISGNAATATTATSTSGNAATATALQTARTINGTSFNGTANITITANTPNALTFNNAGAGAASGTTFNGGTAQTISYNTIGAPSTTGTGASGTWGINITGNAATATSATSATSATTATTTTGNAGTATTLQTARNFSITGGATAAAVSFNGSAAVALNVTSLNAPSLSGVVPNASISGAYDGFTSITVSGAAELPTGVNGGYGSTNGSGATWGANIWGMGPPYDGSGLGTAFVPTSQYGLSWLRASHANATANIGEGLYIYQNGVLQGGIGTTGVYSVGAILATGDITAFSDRRLKKDIEPIWNALDKVKQLNGVTFKRTDTGDYGVGLIAQDVQAVVPEAVKEQENGMLSVAYGNMVGVLVEAIKEMSAQMDAMRAEIKALKGEA